MKQIFKNNNSKSVLFSGDGTIASMYSGQFNKSYPQPSFGFNNPLGADMITKQEIVNTIHYKTDITLFIGHL